MQQSNASDLLTNHFRCPKDVIDSTLTSRLATDPGYFQSGSDAVCCGQCSSGLPATLVTDALRLGRSNGTTIQLPVDLVEVVDNLRLERYAASSTGCNERLAKNSLVRNLYYSVRPVLPVAVRKHLQQMYLRGWDKVPFPTWPVDRTVEKIIEQLFVFAMKSRNLDRVPFIWFWPDGAPSCTIMTHDVETSSGANFCPQLMDLNDAFGIKASFQIVPEERYPVPQVMLDNIRNRGFEVNVHDLNHDGRLFSERAEFLRRAERINRYAQQFSALGFRSAVLYRNVDWYDSLNFSYDMSIPNVGHLDPQRGGCCTVLPFFIGRMLELPVTVTQDYSLFHILNDYSIRLWKQQISMIREKHGLISFIIHPDYIIAQAARRVYAELLEYLSQLRSSGETWIALPREVDAWWRLRSELSLVKEGGFWHIKGPGSERARVAYAVLAGDTLTYELAESPTSQQNFRNSRSEALIAC